jgi:hypothetical protein
METVQVQLKQRCCIFFYNSTGSLMFVIMTIDVKKMAIDKGVTEYLEQALREKL